jgi:hypothetical protein
MFDDAQQSESENIKLTAALHGVKIKGAKNQEQKSSSIGQDGDDAPIFGDPKDYEHMSAEQREAETQKQMAALMRLPFSSKIKGLGGN